MQLAERVVIRYLSACRTEGRADAVAKLSLVANFIRRRQSPTPAIIDHPTTLTEEQPARRPPGQVHIPLYVHLLFVRCRVSFRASVHFFAPVVSDFVPRTLPFFQSTQFSCQWNIQRSPVSRSEFWTISSFPSAEIPMDEKVKRDQNPKVAKHIDSTRRKGTGRRGSPGHNFC
jgi:hypothetical protein